MKSLSRTSPSPSATSLIASSEEFASISTFCAQTSFRSTKYFILPLLLFVSLRPGHCQITFFQDILLQVLELRCAIDTLVTLLHPPTLLPATSRPVLVQHYLHERCCLPLIGRLARHNKYSLLHQFYLF